MVTLLLLSLLTCTCASELSCAGHFPIKESVEIVKKLVEKYAVPVVRKDDNGVEWMNNLIVKNQGLEVGEHALAAFVLFFFWPGRD
ncbi:hypothetical protein Y032_0054g2460 [Ancylostoma ceylanicum]|uniref:Uncharacterized protein n=1 Tax=Ancylostoma ceylanicum TaxID=53326 RepID=A0A016U7R2_9BILA|nr:hypothetical protein Y032_0054g2460 [Ancylostoma ceylanicum]